jgi:uncharacterized protein
MSSAKDLLISYLENINNPERAIELFADDATIELPYLHSLGMQWQWHGKEVLFDFLKNLPAIFSGFEFRNVQIHIDTPDQVFGEYEVHCIVVSTGLAYNQIYMGRLVAVKGKIKLIREALDMAEVAKSMFPASKGRLDYKNDE